MRLIHKSIPITDRSSIGEARRVAVQLGHSLGFTEERRSDIGIAVTEVATNVLVHGQGGELLLCPFSQGDSVWLDVLALDSGPGIANIGRAREDGFSTTGTAGHGLGAIERLSDETSLYSLPGKGAAHAMRFVAGQPPGFSAGIVNVPLRGETACGDGFFVQKTATRSLYMVVDGLGHGTGAAEAADEAIGVVARSTGESLTEILVRSHDALKKTRGAAMSIARVDHQRCVLTYAGVGNVGATLFTSRGGRALVSQNGTLGAALPRVPQEYTYPIERDTSLLMFSDGLSSRTSVSGHAGLQNRHPALIAGILYRDFSRKRDDATALVAVIGGEAA